MSSRILDAVSYAWLESAGCLGRYALDILQVRDMRAVENIDDLVAAAQEHLAMAFDGGNIQVVVSVLPGFKSLGWRICNRQLIEYLPSCVRNVVQSDAYMGFLVERATALGWGGRLAWRWNPRRVVATTSVAQAAVSTIIVIGGTWLATDVTSGLVLIVLLGVAGGLLALGGPTWLVLVHGWDARAANRIAAAWAIGGAGGAGLIFAMLSFSAPALVPSVVAAVALGLIVALRGSTFDDVEDRT